jgi:hypothetical protein
MSFVSASQPAPGKRSGKQNRPRFGRKGSTEASKASPLDGARHLALRPGVQAENGGLEEPAMPNATQSLLLYAFCCFPPASPAFVPRAGKQKTAPKDRSKPLISLRKSGAGEGIRTPDPNLGKVELRAELSKSQIARSDRRTRDGLRRRGAILRGRAKLIVEREVAG